MYVEFEFFRMLFFIFNVEFFILLFDVEDVYFIYFFGSVLNVVKV